MKCVTKLIYLKQNYFEENQYLPVRFNSFGKIHPSNIKIKLYTESQMPNSSNFAVDGQTYYFKIHNESCEPTLWISKVPNPRTTVYLFINQRFTFVLYNDDSYNNFAFINFTLLKDVQLDRFTIKDAFGIIEMRISIKSPAETVIVIFKVISFTWNSE